MSGLHRRFEGAALEALLRQAGLGAVRLEPALGGCAWLATGRR
jgi:hypothetical protein